jgi:uncharacterized protein YndB with AHSA1/START domain
MSSVIRKEIQVNASPDQVWEAWTDPERIVQWFADKASGWPAPGGKLSLRWERFNFSVDYQIAEAEQGRRLVLKARLPGLGTGTISLDFLPRGPGCLVRLEETGPDTPPSDEPNAAESGWEMTLAIMKLYVENYFGQPRSSFFAMMPAKFNYERVMYFYSTEEGLARWLAGEGSTFGGRGGTYRFTLQDGTTASGRVLAVTAHEVALEWSEIHGYLELKSFPMEPGIKAICARGAGWGLDPARAAQIEKMLEGALTVLFIALAEPAETAS